MDFVRVLDRIDAVLTTRGSRYALAGGVALAAYGHPRLTLDLDIVTEADAQDELVASMGSAGYVTLDLLTLDGTDRREAREYFARASLLQRWEDLERGL